MTRSRGLPEADAHRLAMQRRLDRLKVTIWAAAAGAWLALWSLVSGAVAVTATPATTSAASQQESTTTDLFGTGSTLGVGSGTPILRSSGS